MKNTLTVAALLAILIATVTAADVASETLVVGVFLDAFVPVRLDALTHTNAGCADPGTSTRQEGALVLAASGRSFRWSEDDRADTRLPAPSATPPEQPGGYVTSSCASIGFEIPIPAGTDHVHLRFNATREIVCAESQTAICPRFVQRLVLSGPGQGALGFDYFNFTDGPRATTAINPLPPFRPTGALNLTATWFFQEVGSSTIPEVGNLRPSGSAYASVIANPVLEFSSIPAIGVVVETTERRAGSQVFDDIFVSVPIAAPAIAEGLGTDLRIRFDPIVTFREVRAPDGAILTERVTRENDGPNGFDRSKILLERTLEYTQITVPGQVIREHGAGTYTLVETRELPLSAAPTLIPIAALLMVAPVPFAIIAARQAHVFERESFGGFRTAARNLRVALVVVLLYYFAVVGAALIGGGANEMTTLPLSVAGVFLYLQLALAALSFAALYLVARALYRITVPPSVEPPSDP